MAYNENLVNRIRELFADQPEVLEKRMFQGLCFMVNDKLCICVKKHDILCRIGEKHVQQEIEKHGYAQMIHNGRPMKDYVFVDDMRSISQADLEYWIRLCLEFNIHAKSSKK